MHTEHKHYELQSMTKEEITVLATNQLFYKAFDAADVQAMDSLWSATAPVTCVHPGSYPLIGREEVMRSWQTLFQSETTKPHVEATDINMTMIGGNIAYVLCEERLSAMHGTMSAKLIATNVFLREGEDWRLIHHHSGPYAFDSEEVDTKKPEPHVWN